MVREICPLCSSSQTFVHLHFEYTNVLRCGSCDFMFSEVVGSPEEIFESYRLNFHSERHRLGQIINASLSYRLLMKMSGHLGSLRGLRFLEIGSGYGFLLSKCRNSFSTVSGVEPSFVERAHSLRLSSSSRVYDSIDQVPESSADLIFSSEVVEHVADPIQFVSQLSRSLSSNGYCLIVTDNFECDIALSLKESFPKWIPHSHISHFSPSTLRKLFLECGFDVVFEFDYTPLDMLVLYLSRRFRLGSLDSNTLAYMDAEFSRQFRFFHLRKLLNYMYFSLSNLGRKGAGSLIGIVAVKK